MPSFRVFVTCDIGEEALKRLQEAGGEVEVYPGERPPPKELIVEKVRSGIDALIVMLRDRIDAEVFEAGRGTLRVVGLYAVGFDNIDREAANRCRIPFTHTPDVLTDATAEFALFMLGCVARKLYPSERFLRERKWKVWHPWRPFLGDEVTGKTVGVIGPGRIGKAFILKCSGLSVDFLCYHRRGEDREFRSSLQRLLDLQHETGLAPRRSVIRYVSFREALSESDFVSLHVPLNQDTRRLINRETLGWMKPTAYLINTTRGPVVDEQALWEALKEKRIAGAALDVFEKEPLPDESPLRDPDLSDRLRLFHHIGSGTWETRLSPDSDRGMAGRCVQGVLEVLGGRNPAEIPLVVNREAFR